MIDAEINSLLNDSYKRAMHILVTHKKELHLLSGISSFWYVFHYNISDPPPTEALLKYETLDADDVKTIIEQRRPPTPKAPQSSGLLGLKPALPLSGLQGLPATQIGKKTPEGTVAS